MTKPYPPVHYSNYLQLNKILDAQSLRSEEFGHPAHDEHLFIVVHQTYELWFKQILFEIESVRKLFDTDSVDESNMGTAVARLHRVIEIEKVLIDQIRILETMTPLDFLDFRDYLYPASGFQSAQFRLVENKLGLKKEKRLNYSDKPYSKAFEGKEYQDVLDAENQPSIFELVERWLERTPFLKTDQFDFWQKYKSAAEEMFMNEESIVKNHPELSDDDKEKNLLSLKDNREGFMSLFDETEYNRLREKGVFRISYKALHGALLIKLYRDEPILQLPFSLITALQDIDELFTTWRYRHALMALRMLGTKIGTGGSSGHKYLRATTEKHKIFQDFFNLATYLIPRSHLPDLPSDYKKTLGFHYSSNR